MQHYRLTRRRKIFVARRAGYASSPGSTSVPTVPGADMPEVCAATSALSSARLRRRHACVGMARRQTDVPAKRSSQATTW